MQTELVVRRMLHSLQKRIYATIKHILFPVDFSEACRSTAPFVASMARRCGANITLLYVIEPFWYYSVGEAPPILLDVEETAREIESSIRRTFCDDLSGLSVNYKVKVGDPARLITEFAQSSGVNLVMMPTHGYGLFREMLLRSVTAKVLHDCTTPVWTSAHVKGSQPLFMLTFATFYARPTSQPRAARCFMPQQISLSPWARSFGWSTRSPVPEFGREDRWTCYSRNRS